MENDDVGEAATPDPVDVALQGVRLVEQRGDLAGGLALLTRAVGLAPSHAQFCFEQARCLVFMGSYDEAWETAAAYVHARGVVGSDGAFREHCTVDEIALVVLALVVGFVVNDATWRKHNVPAAFYARLVRYFCTLRPSLLEHVYARVPVVVNFAATIVALLPFHAAPQPAPSSQNRLFVLGDSHVLPIAWQTVRAAKATPLLCIGLKAWNFGEGQVSREAAILASHLACLPDPDDGEAFSCIFVAGEIDCRLGRATGMTRAIARQKYRSLDDAVEKTTEVYVARLVRECAVRPNMTALVHPVRPPPTPRPSDNDVAPDLTGVLAQRDVIVAFNRCLKRRVEEAGVARLQFINGLYDRLSNPEDNGLLRGEFQNPNDEVHLAPSYVQLL